MNMSAMYLKKIFLQHKLTSVCIKAHFLKWIPSLCFYVQLQLTNPNIFTI